MFSDQHYPPLSSSAAASAPSTATAAVPIPSSPNASSPADVKATFEELRISLAKAKEAINVFLASGKTNTSRKLLIQALDEVTSDSTAAPSSLLGFPPSTSASAAVASLPADVKASFEELRLLIEKAKEVIQVPSASSRVLAQTSWDVVSSASAPAPTSLLSFPQSASSSPAPTALPTPFLNASSADAKAIFKILRISVAKTKEAINIFLSARTRTSLKVLIQKLKEIPSAFVAETSTPSFVESFRARHREQQRAWRTQIVARMNTNREHFDAHSKSTAPEARDAEQQSTMTAQSAPMEEGESPSDTLALATDSCDLSEYDRLSPQQKKQKTQVDACDHPVTFTPSANRTLAIVPAADLIWAAARAAAGAAGAASDANSAIVTTSSASQKRK